MTPSSNAAREASTIKRASSCRLRVVICIAIFLIAFGARLLSWQDTRFEVGKVQTVVAGDYKRIGKLFQRDGISGFYSSSSELADLNNLGHPPGYSILIGLVYSLAGESDAAVQLTQIIFDALSAVLIFLIGAELFALAPAIVTGLLAAFSPQLTWNSVLLLPDSLAVFPILLAVFCLTRALRNPRLLWFIACGACVGISCWLRANAMLLAFFFAIAALLLIKTRPKWIYAATIVFASILIVLPLTIRNAVVVHRFVPVSLGGGQTFLEGIADYDKSKRFGIPETDMGIMKQEAEVSQRPEYYGTLFNPDGVERERARFKRGFAVVRSHPFWFAGVIVQRAASMLRLERARLIATAPPPIRSLDSNTQSQPIWSQTPAELMTSGQLLSTQAKTSMSLGGQMMELACDNSKSGRQFMSAPIKVQAGADYALNVPFKIEQGRLKAEVIDDRGSSCSSAIIEPEETKDGTQQVRTITLPFAATAGPVRLIFSNEAPATSNSSVSVGALQLYELGPSQFLWTRYPRLLIHGIQKLFLTATILPLAILGLVVVLLRRNLAGTVVLAIVPSYYFLFQSAFHTEYRYVLAMNYFVFAFAATAMVWVAKLLWVRLASLRPVSARSNR